MKDPVSARSKTVRIAIDALLIAVYVILGTFCSFKVVGTVQVSFSTLPILLCAFLLRPSDAIAVAVIGNLLEQIIDPSPYGYTTLILWLIPGAVQALVASLGAQRVRKIDSPKKALAMTIAVIICAEILLTLINTPLLYLDGYILHYPVKALNLLLPLRILNMGVRCAISCILIPVLLPPLQRVIAKHRLN